MGWSRENGPLLQEWFRRLSDESLLNAKGQIVPVYQVAIVGPVWDVIKGFIESGMRQGGGEREWERMMMVYETKDSLLEALNLSEGQEPLVIGVSETLEVLFQTQVGLSNDLDDRVVPRLKDWLNAQ